MPDRFLGQRIGDYVIEERIGGGSMAVVYRAFQPSIQRYVALKIMRLDGMFDDDEFRRRFAQEAALIARLEHIHILPVYDYGLANTDMAYIAMRVLSGGSLADLLADGPLPLDRAADIITQIARGLSHAHRHGIIHRDLKPTNILFDSAGNAYLTDFGLAKALATPDMTRPGQLVGTPAYVSPESLRGDPVDHRSDIYSFGVLAYEMLAGRPPFVASGGSILSLIRAHLELEPPKMQSFNPAIPPAVEAVIQRALRKRPEERYNDAIELADALNAALGRRYRGGSFRSLRLLKPAPTPRAKLTHPRFILPLLAIGIVLIALWLVLGPANAPEPRPIPTILAETRGGPEDAVPSHEELALARAQIGGGFIAYMVCTMESEFQVTRAREIGDFAAEFDLPYRVYDGQNDGRRQIAEIERARREGAKAFIICPLDADLLIPTLERLKAEQIPVVFITLFRSGYGIQLDADNYTIGLEMGRLAGQIIADEYGGEATVALLGFPGFPASEQRMEGMRAGVLEHAPDATFLGAYRAFDRDEGYEVIKTLLDEGTRPDAILCINDAGGFGAVDALSEAGIPPSDVFIVSANAEALALEYIRDGNYLRGTIDTNRELGSHTALNAAIRLLAGGTMPEILLIPPGDMVTRESLASES